MLLKTSAVAIVTYCCYLSLSLSLSLSRSCLFRSLCVPSNGQSVSRSVSLRVSLAVILRIGTRVTIGIRSFMGGYCSHDRSIIFVRNLVLLVQVKIRDEYVIELN